MAISLLSVATKDVSAGVASTTVTKPSPAPAANDLMLFGVETDTAATVTLTGWTVVNAPSVASQQKHSLYVKYATGSEGATQAVSASGGLIYEAFWAAFPSVDTTTAQDATALSGTGTGSTITGDALTTVTDHAWAISAFATWTPSAAPATPSGWTNVTRFGSGGDFVTVSSKDVSPAGSSTAPATSQSTTEGWTKQTMALRPSSGGGSTIPPGLGPVVGMAQPMQHDAALLAF